MNDGDSILPQPETVPTFDWFNVVHPIINDDGVWIEFKAFTQ